MEIHLHEAPSSMRHVVVVDGRTRQPSLHCLLTLPFSSGQSPSVPVFRFSSTTLTSPLRTAASWSSLRRSSIFLLRRTFRSPSRIVLSNYVESDDEEEKDGFQIRIGLAFVFRLVNVATRPSLSGELVG